MSCETKAIISLLVVLLFIEVGVSYSPILLHIHVIVGGYGEQQAKMCNA